MSGQLVNFVLSKHSIKLAAYFNTIARKKLSQPFNFIFFAFKCNNIWLLLNYIEH